MALRSPAWYSHRSLLFHCPPFRDNERLHQQRFPDFRHYDTRQLGKTLVNLCSKENPASPASILCLDIIGSVSLAKSKWRIGKIIEPVQAKHMSSDPGNFRKAGVFSELEDLEHCPNHLHGFGRGDPGCVCTTEITAAELATEAGLGNTVLPHHLWMKLPLTRSVVGIVKHINVIVLT